METWRALHAFFRWIAFGWPGVGYALDTKRLWRLSDCHIVEHIWTVCKKFLMAQERLTTVFERRCNDKCSLRQLHRKRCTASIPHISLWLLEAFWNYIVKGIYQRWFYVDFALHSLLRSRVPVGDSHDNKGDLIEMLHLAAPCTSGLRSSYSASYTLNKWLNTLNGLIRSDDYNKSKF